VDAPLVPCFAEDTLSEIEPFLHFGLPLFELLHAILECLEPRGRVFGWLTAGGTELRDPEDGECRDPHEYEECSEKDRRFHVRQSLFGVTTRFRKYATVPGPIHNAMAPDADGIALLSQWIDSLPAHPAPAAIKSSKP